MKRALLLAVGVLLAGAAQDASAQDLEPLVDRLTKAWNRADAGAIASMAAPDGVSLEIGGARVGPVPARQLAAALRKLFDNVETLSARAGMAQVVSGSPRRAFVEITWTTRARGTTVPERSTVILGLTLDADRWRVTEIRHLK